MNLRKIARYAKLFKEVCPDSLDKLFYISDLILRDEVVFYNPTVSREYKLNYIRSLTKVEDKLMKILSFLLKRRDIKLLRAIVIKTKDLIEKERGIKSIKVVASSQEELEEILKTLPEDAEIDSEVDSSLIKGAIVQEDFLIVDSSTKNKLNRFIRSLK